MRTIENCVNEKIREAVPVEVKVYEEGDSTLNQVCRLSIHNTSLYKNHTHF